MSVNKVILVGNLGADPEIRYSGNNNAIATVNLATSRTWRDRSSGEKQEKTEWHRVVFFGRLGEIVAEFLKKGSQIYVEGRMQTRKWQDRDGHDRYTTEVIADEMRMLGRGSRSGDHQQSHSADNASPYHEDMGSGESSNDSFDDDIPF